MAQADGVSAGGSSPAQVNAGGEEIPTSQLQGQFDGHCRVFVVLLSLKIDP